MRAVPLALAALLLVAGAAGAADEIRSVPTARGATQPFVLVRPPAAPVATVILFAGGDGNLRLAGRGRMGLGGNFLVRTRDTFAGHGFLVVVPDAPSDRAAEGLTGYRTSAEHADDVRALIEFARAAAATPVWLVGTSMGTVSAASVAARLGPGLVDGIVLTATVTMTSRSTRESTRDVRLGDLRVPVFIVHHEADGCWASPPHEADRLLPLLTAAPRTAARFFRGGGTPRSGPCEPFAPHGFLGLEPDVVAAIAAFIRGDRP